jgi:hypothetical protein
MAEFAGRVVLLGASNVARGISIVVESARLVCGAPLELLAAFGHGRSYGVPAGVWGRTLPGIVQCGLWRALEEQQGLTEQQALRTVALVADVGNDLAYGFTAEQVAEWVEICLQRLVAVEARTAIMRLPLAVLERLPAWQFELMRRVLFPRRRIVRSEVLRQAASLDEALVRLAAEYGARAVEPRAEWYGLDPIHLRRAVWSDAWGEMLGSAMGTAARAQGSLRRWLYLRTRLPHEQRWLGWQQRRAQPCGRLADGTRLWFY